jgi:hypothetical protein
MREPVTTTSSGAASFGFAAGLAGVPAAGAVGVVAWAICTSCAKALGAAVAKSARTVALIPRLWRENGAPDVVSDMV